MVLGVGDEFFKVVVEQHDGIRFLVHVGRVLKLGAFADPIALRLTHSQL